MSGKKKSETRKIRSLEKIRQINKVSVFYGDKKVGELAMTPTQRCAFEYDKDYTVNKNFVEGYQSSKDGKKLSKLVYVVQQIHLELYKKF